MGVIPNLPARREEWAGFPNEYDLQTEIRGRQYSIYILRDWDAQEVVVYVPLRHGWKEAWGLALTADEFFERERERDYLQKRYGTHRVKSISDYWIRNEAELGEHGQIHT